MSSCQKDLTLNDTSTALKKQNKPIEAVSIVKKESFANDVFKTTYSNGMEMYTFPSQKDGSSNALPPLSCSTPVNSENITADGCACLHFHSFGVTPIPGGGSAGGFYFDEEKFYSFDSVSSKPHEYYIYLKIMVNINPDLHASSGTVWYEGYLPWERPDLASCTDSYSRLIFWHPSAYNWCHGYLNVTAKKYFDVLIYLKIGHPLLKQNLFFPMVDIAHVRYKQLT